MDKIIVLGAGLLGQAFKRYYGLPVIDHTTCDITSRFDVDAVFAKYQPKVVVNAAGIVPRVIDDIMTLFKVNAAAPRYLATACDEIDARLIQISTDCVFSGRKGGYKEYEIPDAEDLYGLSKSLGEITEFPHLTVRTSFVGLPDEKERGLLAWALKQKVVTGYDKVIWNGLTTKELVRMLVEVVIPMKLSNIIHLHGQTVTKYDLLKQAKLALNLDYQLVKESEVTETPHEWNKTLDSDLPEIQSQKTLRQMLEEMKE